VLVLAARWSAGDVDPAACLPTRLLLVGNRHVAMDGRTDGRTLPSLNKRPTVRPSVHRSAHCRPACHRRIMHRTSASARRRHCVVAPASSCVLLPAYGLLISTATAAAAHPPVVMLSYISRSAHMMSVCTHRPSVSKKLCTTRHKYQKSLLIRLAIGE